MKKLMLAVAATLAVATPLAAFAAPPKSSTASKPAKANDTLRIGRTEYTTGIVGSWSADTRMLKLNAGEEFKIAPTVTAATYKAGDKVNVRWTMKGRARVADAVTMK